MNWYWSDRAPLLYQTRTDIPVLVRIGRNLETSYVWWMTATTRVDIGKVPLHAFGSRESCGVHSYGIINLLTLVRIRDHSASPLRVATFSKAVPGTCYSTDLRTYPSYRRRERHNKHRVPGSTRTAWVSYDVGLNAYFEHRAITAIGWLSPAGDFFYCYYFPSHLLSSPFFLYLPPSRNSDPGSHSRLFSPLPTTVRALHFYREKISAVFSLVDSRRTVLTHARRSQQLILSLLLQINSKSHHGGIRTHGPTLVAFEGYH